MRIGIVHPCRDVAQAMQYAPDIDVFGTFDVEDQVRIACQRPEAQTGKIQLVRVAGRSAGRMAADVGVGLLQRVNEVQRGFIGPLAQVVSDGLIDISIGQLTRDDRL